MPVMMFVENHAFAIAETGKAVGTLPIESTKDAPAVRPDSGQNEGHYNLNDGVVFEVYDKQGNVSLRVPQKLDPIDEVV